MNAITGGKHKPQNQSGLGGLASSFLGGGHGKPTSQGSSGQGGIGGLTGRLVGSLSAEKPNAQPQQQHSTPQSSGYGGSSSGGQQSGGGLMGFFGGNHGSSVSLCDHCYRVRVLTEHKTPEQ